MNRGPGGSHALTVERFVVLFRGSTMGATRSFDPKIYTGSERSMPRQNLGKPSTLAELEVHHSRPSR